MCVGGAPWLLTWLRPHVIVIGQLSTLIFYMYFENTRVWSRNTTTYRFVNSGSGGKVQDNKAYPCTCSWETRARGLNYHQSSFKRYCVCLHSFYHLLKAHIALSWLVDCKSYEDILPWGVTLSVIIGWFRQQQRNYNHDKVWDKMTSPFPNFNGWQLQIRNGK